MRECDKSKNTCKQQLHIVYMSFNNVGHLITSTITTLQHFATLYHTSPNFTSLTKLHFTVICGESPEVNQQRRTKVGRRQLVHPSTPLITSVERNCLHGSLWLIQPR